MYQSTKHDCGFAAELRERLNSDPLIQLLAGTTTLKNVSPEEIPLALMAEICAETEVITIHRNDSLDLSEEREFVFEILEGCVKIYAQPVSKPDQQSTVNKNPPALLAWRIKGELLGDFRFANPDEESEDWIVATDECRLLKLPASLLHRLAQRYPQIYLNIAGNLVAKANKARVRAQILRLPNIKCKTAQLFIDLLAERGTSNGENSEYPVLNGTFRIDDLAAFLGYEEHATQIAVNKMIKGSIIKHHKSKVSGRYEIWKPDGFATYLDSELTKVEEQKLRKRQRRKSKKTQRSQN